MKIRLSYDSPVAEWIAHKLLVPLIKHKPPEKNLVTFMWDDIFHLHERSIDEWRVLRDFDMPGLFCVAPTQKDQYRGYRKIKRGDVIWARKDITIPNQVDVEVEWKNDRVKEESVFVLTDWEFNRIKKYMKKLKWSATDNGGPKG